MADPGAAEDTASAYLLLEQLRWGALPFRCPHCKAAARCYFLHPSGGRARRTRSGHPSPRRVWKCGVCRRQFSVLTGTVLHGTKIDIRIWVAALARTADEGRPIEASTLSSEFGLSREAAAHVGAVLRALCEVESVQVSLREGAD